MSRFFVGQRVRIVRFRFHPELLGVETRIVAGYQRATNPVSGEWWGWPLEIRIPGRVVAREECIEPILPSGHQLAELSVEELLPFLKEQKVIA